MKKNILILSFIFIIVINLCSCNSRTASENVKNLSSKETEKDVDYATMTMPKIITYEQSAEFSTLDPALTSSLYDFQITENIFEKLVKYKSYTTELEPGLAESWDISSDGKEYTFNLRKGVSFHDGTQFNADAVIFNVERQMKSNSKGNMPYADFIYGHVEKIEKIDEYKVKFYLKEPYAPFVYNLAIAAAAIASPDAIKKYGEDFAQNPIGTGPFKLNKIEKNQYVKLVRNENYWNGLAKADAVIFMPTGDSSKRISDIVSGNADIIEMEMGGIDKLTSSNVSIIKKDVLLTRFLGFNCDKPPFDNAKSRQVVSKLVNREDIINRCYKGYAELANAMLPRNIKGCYDGGWLYSYDIDEAKKMARDIGLDKIELNLVTNSSNLEIAKVVKEYLSKGGLNVKLTEYKQDYWDKLYDGVGNMFVYGWAGDTADIDNYLFIFETKEIKNKNNYSKYSNKEVDELLKKARTKASEEERYRLYESAQKILMKDIPMIPIAYPYTLKAYSPKIKNLTVHPIDNIYFKDVEKE